jgi:hypothetical protein
MSGPANPDGENLRPALTGAPAPAQRKPMLWVFPEYGGQVAVRIGKVRIVRQQLNTKKPGEWEVYDLSKDRSEATDIASDRSSPPRDGRQRSLPIEDSGVRLPPGDTPSSRSRMSHILRLCYKSSCVVQAAKII